MRLSRTSSAIFSIIVALFTWKGTSVMMIASRSPRICSIVDLAAHDDRAAAGRIGAVDAGAAEDDAAGREIRAGNDLHQLPAGRSPDCRSARCVASMTSPRLCGGMLVAMPTAMPPAPLTSRLGKRAGRTVGSLLGRVVVVLEIDGVLVDVLEQLVRHLGRAATRCSASPPADRRRSSRNCPARRSAARAATNPAPCAPARRRSRRRRADGIYPSRRRPARADFTYLRFQW